MVEKNECRKGTQEYDEEEMRVWLGHSVPRSREVERWRGGGGLGGGGWPVVGGHLSGSERCVKGVYIYRRMTKRTDDATESADPHSVPSRLADLLGLGYYGLGLGYYMALV